MGKIILTFAFVTMCAYAQELQTQDSALQQNCISCHQEHQIPSFLIYKRYLMKYSTAKRMEDAMTVYMKDPSKEHSIMPAPFFLKFPMKVKTDLRDVSLRKNIQSYLEMFDIKKKLRLEE